MRYVIQHKTDSNFVSRPGSEKSYTFNVLNARTFTSREAAHAFGVCDNEHVVCVEDILSPSPQET